MNERLEAEEPGHAQGCGLPSILTAEDVVKTDCFRVRLAMPGANSSILDQTKSLIQQDNNPGAAGHPARRPIPICRQHRLRIPTEATPRRKSARRMPGGIFSDELTWEILPLIDEPLETEVGGRRR